LFNSSIPHFALNMAIDITNFCSKWMLFISLCVDIPINKIEY